MSADKRQDMATRFDYFIGSLRRVRCSELLPQTVAVQPVFWSVVATLLILLPIALSSSSWAQTTWLPHSHTRLFDVVYYVLDPLALYLVSGFVTLLVLCWPGHFTPHDWRRHPREVTVALLQAAMLLLAATVFLFGIENLLKRGFARARPVAEAEHALVAAYLEGWLPPEFVAAQRAELFECPVGRFVFDPHFRRENGALSEQLVRARILSADDAAEHIKAIHQRTGVGPNGTDVADKSAALREMAPWRHKDLVPFLADLLPGSIGGHDKDDLDGSTPSGHILRQSFVLFLFFRVAYDRAGISIRKWTYWWKRLFALQGFSFFVCLWSRLYGYDHSWSDELISFALTIGVLSFAYLMHRTVLDSKRGILKLVFDPEASGLMRSMPLLVVAFDRSGHVLLWNQEAERVTGYRASEVPTLKEYVRKIYPSYDPQFVLERILRMMTQRHGSENVIVRIRAKDGTAKLIVWTGTPIPDADGSISGKLSIGFEISSVDRRLADVGAAATSVLQYIAAQVATLERSPAVTPAMASLFTYIGRVYKGYHDYVAGHSALDEMTPAGLIDFAAAALAAEAGEQHVTFERFVQPNIPPVVGQEYLLRHALIDLLRTAVKSSASVPRACSDSPRVVSITARRNIEKACVEIEVADDGPPLPRELRRWFTCGPIYDGISDDQRDMSLGLLLANIAAREHGGWISRCEQDGRNISRLVLPVLSRQADAVTVSDESRSSLTVA